MREILFRAKCKRTYKWVFGSLILPNTEKQKYDTYLYAFNNESEIIENIHDIENQTNQSFLNKI